MTSALVFVSVFSIFFFSLWIFIPFFRGTTPVRVYCLNMLNTLLSYFEFFDCECHYHYCLKYKYTYFSIVVSHTVRTFGCNPFFWGKILTWFYLYFTCATEKCAYYMGFISRTQITYGYYEQIYSNYMKQIINFCSILLSTFV